MQNGQVAESIIIKVGAGILSIPREHNNSMKKDSMPCNDKNAGVTTSGEGNNRAKGENRHN